MTIYIDNDFKCHAENDGTMREVETGFFNGKATYFIESYRYVPDGERWVSPDGVIYRGEMITPWRDYSIAATVQEAFEQAKSEDAELFGIIDGSVTA